jgi:DNA-binding GntR family transcriptional regulator
MALIMPWTTPGPSTAMLSHVRDIPLGNIIRDEVLAAILRGEFAPGDRITEPMIAGRLGVSRVPVREALRELEAMGLLESRKHAGMLVRQLSAQETAELYELRSVIDAHAGRVAGSVSDPALVAALEQCLAKMEAAAQRNDLMAYYEANVRFHWDIVQACGNSQIIAIYQGAVQKLHLARLRNLSTDVGILNSLMEHHAIVDAIRQGQAEWCAELMSHHVKAAGERLKKVLFGGDKNEEKRSA